ncbi:carotenoid 9 10(9 10)-cleavage dioxygenase 1-like [Prunus yedoensis var. nudiflora]|uniref:Carotenoid 9 10(9 10)-cleavage dioxygenase 1-like n=1 Tax=Prunus yedoensis var. nudiflora TaxID=2094558 RepID=A0A314YD95_PRUYE|nr:carotenoid 9 10(9 10)-cleavage dioxygenase 1-like [Prunus yedoensis var. nudiflora]
MASSCMSIQLKCFALQKKPSVSNNLEYFKTTLSSSAFMVSSVTIVDEKSGTSTPMQIGVSKTFKNASSKVLDFLVDSMFEFVDQSLLPSQSNFGP